ncbi:hypothetical protein [Kitasatospora viridis]|uniref:Uncharacterized protein n=1 Tax=Kitasatospora viridis TaxID=281105 RepID=A0A561SG75_9ACTN|nr:hypothetical protein [Kitasatospora viridis]TWF73859.1 hypothetical protein FHX73_15486 [Kitasatospora viridis]
MQDGYDWQDDGTTFRPPAACPLCAGELRQVELGPSNELSGLSVRVHVARKLFARKSRVEALACRGCGHLLTFMANPEVMDEPPAKTRRKG